MLNIKNKIEITKGKYKHIQNNNWICEY